VENRNPIQITGSKIKKSLKPKYSDAEETPDVGRNVEQVKAITDRFGRKCFLNTLFHSLE
jgi:hypothetical protein